MCGVESLTKWKFTCLSKDAVANCEQSFDVPGDSWFNYITTWVEDQEGRMFSCVLDRTNSKHLFDRLFVVTYHRQKFVRIGSSAKKVPGVFRLYQNQGSVYEIRERIRKPDTRRNTCLLQNCGDYFDKDMCKWVLVKILQLKC